MASYQQTAAICTHQSQQLTSDKPKTCPFRDPQIPKSQDQGWILHLLALCTCLTARNTSPVSKKMGLIILLPWCIVSVIVMVMRKQVLRNWGSQTPVPLQHGGFATSLTGRRILALIYLLNVMKP